MLTQRQAEILNGIIGEYIKLAQPVSSQMLGKKKELEISSATIRNEMQRLTDKGYLFQPHTSAGRVPTDKGYRFFVDSFMSVFPAEFESGLEGEPFEFIKRATRFLAEESSELALGYLASQGIVWKEGWRDIFEEPEFSEPGLAAAFAGMIDDFEENIDEMLLPEIKVYIGKENPFFRAREFSIITLGFDGGLLAISGPKRMSYDKNISLFQKIWRKN